MLTSRNAIGQTLASSWGRLVRTTRMVVMTMQALDNLRQFSAKVIHVEMDDRRYTTQPQNTLQVYGGIQVAWGLERVELEIKSKFRVNITDKVTAIHGPIEKRQFNIYTLPPAVTAARASSNHRKTRIWRCKIRIAVRKSTKKCEPIRIATVTEVPISTDSGRTRY